MNVSENTLKWMMRFYPPLFFQRIWVKKFYPGFTKVDVKISKSLFNINYNKSIFGGTIFSASDPFYAILLDQIFSLKGYKTKVWLKSADIKYLKPGSTSLFFSIQISEDDIKEAETALNSIGKFVKSFPIEIKNKEGEICAFVNNEVYMRNITIPGKTQTIGY